MKLQLKFKNIVDSPHCVIRMNEQELYRGVTPADFLNEFEQSDSDCILVVEHIDKHPSDTIVEDGKIIRDRSFELEQITIDGYNLEELKWASEFRSKDGAVYTQRLAKEEGIEEEKFKDSDMWIVTSAPAFGINARYYNRYHHNKATSMDTGTSWCY